MPLSDLRSRTEYLLAKADYIISALKDVPSCKEIIVPVLRDYFINELTGIHKEVMEEAEKKPRSSQVLIVGYVLQTSIWRTKPHYFFRTMNVSRVEGGAWLHYQEQNSPTLRIIDFSKLVQALRNKLSSGAFDDWLREDPSKVLFEGMIEFVHAYLSKMKTRSMPD